MRKPRDYDSELKALETKARQLKARRQSQLGELVVASGADALSLEELAGALLAAASTTDRATKEAWRKRGAALFSGERQSSGDSADSNSSEPASNARGTPSPDSASGAT
jgi:hypothetical protein